MLGNRNTFDYFSHPIEDRLFPVQSIDTMKSSRDIAIKMLRNPNSFAPMIDRQMLLIKEAGATHVAIDTPYDTEFLPVLKLWVASARSHNLSVLFRGNFSGWEGWFEYPRIDRATHKKLLQNFLHNNPELFQSGDVFTPCMECENGGPGDPRQTGDIDGYNTFLADEAKIAATEFASQVRYINIYPSMNADIARDIIGPKAIRAFGGIILIDHYTSTTKQFIKDIETIPEQINARVGLGEFGAPIPDLNGSMTQTQQARYINELFTAMYEHRENIPLVNYWTLTGGSTALINEDGTPREAYFTVQNYFKAFNVYGVIYNPLGEVVSGAKVSIDGTPYSVISDGTYQIFVPRQYKKITIQADGYASEMIILPSDSTTTVITKDIRLQPSEPNWWYNTRAYLYKKFNLKI